MEDIRRRVAADVEADKDRRLPFKPYKAEPGGETRKAGEIVNSEELRYLNLNHAFSLATFNPDAIQSHRPGIIGRVIVKVKRKLLSFIWEGLLKEYLDAEKEFNSNLVRLLNASAKYMDARDASNFWELIRKIDYDVTKALDRIERINDEQSATIHSSAQELRRSMDSSLSAVNSRTTLVQAQVESHQGQMQALAGAVAGVEAILSRLGNSPPKDGGSLEPRTVEMPDYRYVLLENRFRGSEAEITKRLSIYPPVFEGVEKKVLEIGPGRGELQLLFREHGIPSYGVDCDEGMIEEAEARGVEVLKGDGIAHMRSLEDASLGGVIAVQVVEHLGISALNELLDLCFRKVSPGGRVVFETIDPRSLLALSSNYFRDPTHVFPLHPDTLAFAMTTVGLKVVETRPLSPVPDGALLKEVPVEEYMTPRWVLTVERLNNNIKQLNRLLYGFQDYCIVAERA